MNQKDVDASYITTIWLCSTKILFYILIFSYKSSRTTIEGNTVVTYQHHELKQTSSAPHLNLNDIFLSINAHSGIGFKRKVSEK